MVSETQAPNQKQTLTKILDGLPWQPKLNEHKDVKVQIQAAVAVPALDLVTLRIEKEDQGKIIRGLLHMLAGRSGGQEATRLRSQAMAARGLAWLCNIPEVPSTLLEGDAAEHRALATIAMVLSDVHDRGVLLEVVTLVGWLALSSHNHALLLGADTEILRVLGDLLGARMPALQKKVAWALCGLARGQNKSLILSEENQHRVVRNLLSMLASSDPESKAIAARCVGSLAKGNRSNSAVLMRTAGKGSSSLYVALKNCAQERAMAVKVEAA
eukprot:CAMPEP_0177694564 /NCGR_PEP_ID=MMETSP0484_2-20121128/3000_1 /TAXON_ID=354590 /ORGANISM="Rhodomonas lens, Strain RHODO" /LENGTH=270 /DNA_ID=CAMNT_0019205449 /DNA_START=85 /DNA_END=894 /DNA_ORIENTATION=+